VSRQGGDQRAAKRGLPAQVVLGSGLLCSSVADGVLYEEEEKGAFN